MKDKGLESKRKTATVIHHRLFSPHVSYIKIKTDEAHIYQNMIPLESRSVYERLSVFLHVS